MKTNKFEIFFYLLIVVLLLLLVASARGQENQTNDIQMSGGQFLMSKTVVAGGGQTMQNASFNASATAGQTVAGKTSSGGQFTLYSGFWTPDDFTPTAAMLVAGGRVTTADGRGLRNARVVLTFPSGEIRATVTGTFGNYRFNDIPAGGTYVFSVISKRFTFAVGTIVQNINDDTTDINFTADPF